MLSLVTGAGGFVGRHLVAHLHDQGDRVAELDHDVDRVDITDPDAMTALVGAVRPDVVYHLAGFSDVGASWEAPLDAFRTNANGTQNVLVACQRFGVGRVVLVSSAEVYGAVSEDELPITERAPLRPVSPYAVSKVAADYLGLHAWLGYKLDVVRVRAFNHIGPGQSNHFVAAALAERIARAEQEAADEVAVGNLAPRRDFTDVRDVVRAYRLLARSGEPGEAYNVCSGHDIAVSEIAEALLAAAKRPLRLRVEAALYRPVDLPTLRGSYERLQHATGWAPEIPLTTTIGDLLDDWRQRVTGEARAAAPGQE